MLVFLLRRGDMGITKNELNVIDMNDIDITF